MAYGGPLRSAAGRYRKYVDGIDEEELAKSLIDSLAASLVAQGRIQPSGMTEAEFQQALTAELRQLVADDVTFSFTLDHQDSLLKEARAFAEASHTDFAIMFYATWIEHWLNWMYVWRAERSGFKKADTVLLIKQPMYQKTGIIWTLTFGAELDVELVDAIRDIASWRNTFVHYKWQPEDEDEPRSQKKDIGRQRLATAESVIDRLSALRNELALGGAQDFFGGRT